MKKLFLPLSFLSLFLIACDKVDDPFETKNTDINTDGLVFDTSFSEFSNTKRVLVLEEFTGFKCQNCPAGTLIAHQLSQTYADQLMVLSIHGSDFAKPENNADGSFSTDFRTPEGDQYLTSFDVESFPSGMVSRLFDDNKFTVGKDEWETRITLLKDQAPKYKIEAISMLNDSTRIVKTKVYIERNAGLTENVKLLILLSENNLIDWQIDGLNILSNYEHNHVFRKSLNGVWGTDLIFTNDSSTFETELVLNQNWKLENLELLYFVYDATSKEIWQANRIKIKD